ncbi:hypothetical protein FDP41_003342 [Naegleria fowleri]|uniref:Uncharacterized protein n=1 Tax=Naegleria fowleri TaxID=5763 RepID=A0A6A5BUA9_NAEFO|nr:uncharacterized protein FDP41_003342 [Naegleria fowleri]KAF0977350.1 hypothetical protein FDP41_003342 [Naegleria fowleri]
MRDFPKSNEKEDLGSEKPTNFLGVQPEKTLPGITNTYNNMNSVSNPNTPIMNTPTPSIVQSKKKAFKRKYDPKDEDWVMM